jgi:YfiH family protein
MFAARVDPDINEDVGVVFTDRLDGYSPPPFDSLNLGRTDLDSPENLRANMRAVQHEVGLEQIVFVNQVHGTNVLRVTDTLVAGWTTDSWLGSRGGTGVPLTVADAMVTRQRSVGLAIRVADCLPVLFADPDAGVVGAAHAGRRGLLGGVLEATVAALRAEGARHIQAWLGPHICGQCYELPEDLCTPIVQRYPQARTRTSWGSAGIDLAAVAASQLSDLGIDLHRLDSCTRTQPGLFSHRGDGPGTGRQMGLVWLA